MTFKYQVGQILRFRPLENLDDSYGTRYRDQIVKIKVAEWGDAWDYMITVMNDNKDILAQEDELFPIAGPNELMLELLYGNKTG